MRAGVSIVDPSSTWIDVQVRLAEDVTLLPGSQLHGYRQVDELRQLGFYCVVRDTELGEQPLTVTDDFPYASDPSLWVQLELIAA